MSDLTITLHIVRERITTIVVPSYIVLGILGNAFCIFYFLQKNQRSSSCAFHLLLVAIINIITVIFGVTAALLDLWDPISSKLLLYCRLRIYINHTLLLIRRIFTVLVSINTYTMASERLTCRMFTQQSNAIKYAIGVVISSPLITIHILIMLTTISSQRIMPDMYSLIFTIYQLLIAGIIPSLTMIIFNYLARFNMRRSTMRYNNIVKREQEHQHLRIVTIQIIIYIISAELAPLTKVCVQLTTNIAEKSQDRKAIEAFVTFIANTFLLYLNTWAPFFIYRFITF
ncbi:unnamed protein product [Adineta ricciae]|uniref:G-protein coupled receptors family 1 profile domain-containing protein n=1 Tax=Adineta ricciae TaxID=249248 RepID=A0A815MHX8_ADIRI|nr:unnamed protein product [Adineta ricciae]CAF1659471.1 unnamed protein product [Adineta ricciae]